MVRRLKGRSVHCTSLKPMKAYSVPNSSFPMKTTSLILATAISFSPIAFAKKTHSGRTKTLTPQEELAGFKLPEGFIIELVASEKDGIINPIDLTFDDAGRLWTQTAEMYPLDPVKDIPWQKLLWLMDHPEEQMKNPEFKRILDLYQGRTKGSDKILILSDLYEKSPTKVDIWADGLALPQSILPYKNGAFVAHGADLIALTDTNNDGKADKRTPILTGFGFTDTHTMAHLLVRGPGDWIHFSHGALNKGEVTAVKSGKKQRIDFSKIARFSLDGKQLEVIGSGLNNIWGFQLRGNGQWYGTEANDLSWSVAPMEPGTGFKGIGNARIRPYQPWMPELHKFRVGGTGISGVAFADDTSGSFPAEWNDVAFLANPITSTVNCVRIIRNPDGTVTAEHLPDLLKSQDDWFRPVNVEFGPDGCLYIADWYNKIISHNELPTTHPDRDKKHGRIWRIRHKSQQPRAIPNMYQVKTDQLISHLKSPSLWEKRAAWHQISDRQAKHLAPALIELAADKQQDTVTRIHALWSLEGIKHFNQDLIVQLLQETDGNLRRETVRSLASFKPNTSNVATLLKSHIHDNDVMVRSQVIRTLNELGQADQNTIDILISACRPELPGNSMGGGYERSFERYLARMTLEKYPKELSEYLNTTVATKQPISHILWAIQALPAQEKEAKFLNIWNKANVKQLDKSTFIAVTQMLKNPAVYEALLPTFEHPNQEKHLVTLAIQNQGQVQSPELSRILETATRTLLQQKETSSIHLGINAVIKLKVPNQNENIVQLLSIKNANDTTQKLCLKALEQSPGKNKSIFVSVLNNDSASFELRNIALKALVTIDPPLALTTVTSWFTQATTSEQSALIDNLSSTPQGSALLLQLLDDKVLKMDHFKLASAERINNSLKKDKRAQSLLKNLQKKAAEEKARFRQTLAKFTAIAEKKGGDPAQGKPLFTALCLSCHTVGGNGAGFAPALDGSAHRENEALLTAILDPDAAIEGNYTLYRIVKKDGSTLEGYLEQKDERGATLRFMGGSKIYVTTAEIKSQSFVSGRSVMPANLISNMDDASVANLLAYIRTLK